MTTPTATQKGVWELDFAPPAWHPSVGYYWGGCTLCYGDNNSCNHPLGVIKSDTPAR